MSASTESAAAVKLGDDPAVPEDQGAVADRRDLLEVGRDQQHGLCPRRAPRRAGDRSRPWRRRRRRRSGPRGPAPRAADPHPARDDDLLLVAAGEGLDRAASGAFGDSPTLCPAPGPRRISRGPAPAERPPAGGLRVEEHVLADRHAAARPTSPSRSRGDEADARRAMASARRLGRRAQDSRRGRPCRRRSARAPISARPTVLLAGAAQPDEGDISPRADVEARPARRRRAGSRGRSAPAPGQRASGRTKSLSGGRPMIDVDQLVRRRVARCGGSRPPSRRGARRGCPRSRRSRPGGARRRSC